MSRLFLVTAVALALPAATMYMKQSPWRVPQYSPEALMAYQKALMANESMRHFRGEDCAAPADEKKKNFDPDYVPPANFTGTWLLKNVTGDVDIIFMLSGVDETGLNFLKKYDYGAGHMVDIINHTGKEFSIVHALKGSKMTETLTYHIGGPEVHNTNHSHDDILCVHWTNRTKNTLVIETIDAKTGNKMPTMARYLWEDRLFNKVHSHWNGTRYECVEHWERVDNKATEEPGPDPGFAAVIGFFPGVGYLY